MLQEASHIKNTVFFIFRYIQCLHLMYSEVAWVLVSSETQFQPQIILVPDYLPDYLSVSYDYNSKKVIVIDGMAEWLSKSDIRSCGQLIPKHLNSLTIMMTLTMGHWLQQWCFFHFFILFFFLLLFWISWRNLQHYYFQDYWYLASKQYVAVKKQKKCPLILKSHTGIPF